MNDFEVYRTLVGAIEARDDVFDLIPSCDRVNDLLSQRIFVMIVDEKVSSHTVAEE